MHDPFVIVTLLALTGVGFLNLLLLLRVLAIVRPPETTTGLLRGTAIPPARTLTFADAKAANTNQWALPTAFVFLSPGCPACKDAIPIVEASIAAADRAGLDVRVLVDGDGAKDVAWLGPPLAGRAVRLSRPSYRLLNPYGAVPSYLFVDENGLVEASGYIGDQGWRSLEAQLAEI